MSEPETNSLVISARREEFEVIRDAIQKLDKASEVTSIPPTVNPGTTSTLPWYGPTPPDPVAGKYLATRVDGRQSGLELTRIEDAIPPRELPKLTHRIPRTRYRIVMYDDVTELPGLDFTKAENQHRVLGTATLEGNTFSIDCEVEHDGERYQPVRMNLKSGKLVRDGEAVLISLECEMRGTGGGTDFFIAEKVTEKQPQERPEPPEPPHVR